jgi:hypothetical protein
LPATDSKPPNYAAEVAQLAQAEERAQKAQAALVAANGTVAIDESAVSNDVLKLTSDEQALASERSEVRAYVVTARGELAETAAVHPSEVCGDAETLRDEDGVLENGLATFQASLSSVSQDATRVSRDVAGLRTDWGLLILSKMPLDHGLLASSRERAILTAGTRAVAKFSRLAVVDAQTIAGYESDGLSYAVRARQLCPSH